MNDLTEVRAVDLRFDALKFWADFWCRVGRIVFVGGFSVIKPLDKVRR